MNIKKILTRLFFVILIVFTFILCFTTFQSIAFSVSIDDEQEIILNEINQKRLQNNLSALELRQDLNLIAKQKAEDLVNNHYFAHYSKNYGSVFDMLKANSIDYKIAGENLAGASKTNIAITGWMESKSHRDNILEKRYKYTGIYVIDSKTYGKIYVQIFLGE